MLNIIGIGPSKGDITLNAIKALKESNVIIGYKKYIDSINDLIDGKEIIKKGMGDEVARGELAISNIIMMLMVLVYLILMKVQPIFLSGIQKFHMIHLTIQTG